MFVKYSGTGGSGIGFVVVGFLLKITILVAFFFAAAENFWIIIDHIEAVINTGIDIELRMIIGQIGWIILDFILAIVAEVVVAFGLIFPIFKAIFWE